MSIKIITTNKKARFNYQIIETYEAGIVLLGSEVKSIRAGNVSLAESFISFKNNEAFLQNSNIQAFQASSYNGHEPDRLRKLLLHELELIKIASKVAEKGLTAVPLKMYFKNGYIKVEIGLGKGKNLRDKRQTIKDRDSQREIKKY